MDKRAGKEKSVKKNGASKDFSARIKSAWAGFISFLNGLPKPKRIALIAGGGAALAGIIAGIVLIVIYLVGPPVTLTLIHPFENPIWMKAIETEARAFDEKHWKIDVRVKGMDFGDVNEEAKKPREWDVAIGSASILGLGNSFAKPPVPFTGTIWGLYYNKAVLASAGLGPAQGAEGTAGAFASGEYSFDDLEKAFISVKGKGVTPIALGSQFVWPLSIWIQALMASGPSLQAASDLAKRDFDLSSPSLQTALAEFSSYLDSGYVSVGHRTQDWPTSIRELVNGKAAFCIVNEQFIASLLAPERSKVGYLPLPGSIKRGKTDWVIGSLVYIGRSSKAGKRGAARKLLSYFESEAVTSSLSSALSAPFYSVENGPTRVIPSVASVTTHPLMELLKKKFVLN
jgi:ABC-type glycerol-3-phosphate transport system substrate-binding protein